MRWTPSGAHQLLQVRTRALNRQLRGDFERWHPELQTAADRVRLARIAPGTDRSPIVVAVIPSDRGRKQPYQ